MTKTEANAALCLALGVEPVGWRVDAGALKAGYGRFATREEAEQRVADQTECSSRYGTPSICADGYPDLTSADALMAVLKKQNIRFELSAGLAYVWRYPVIVYTSSESPKGFGECLFSDGETHGSMLFRAACAAFGIEVD